MWKRRDTIGHTTALLHAGGVCAQCAYRPDNYALRRRRTNRNLYPAAAVYPPADSVRFAAMPIGAAGYILTASIRL
ncbi:MAG: hypothetical protein HRU79_03230 [Ignavibacteria bacterium]|nr:MAG: hypothetical protein HRU79_03230 [Ignavibacteria bacterium]